MNRDSYVGELIQIRLQGLLHDSEDWENKQQASTCRAGEGEEGPKRRYASRRDWVIPYICRPSQARDEDQSRPFAPGRKEDIVPQRLQPAIHERHHWSP